MSYTPSGFGSGGGVAGHIIKNPSDVAQTQRTYLKFVSAGSGTTVGVTDGADVTTIAIPDQLTAAPDDPWSWEGNLHSNWGNGNPELLATHNRMVSQTQGTIYPSTVYHASKGRIMFFSYRKTIVVRRIIYFGIYSSTNELSFAIYGPDGTRIWTSAIVTSQGSWTQITGLNFTLTKGLLYKFGMAATSIASGNGVFHTPTPFTDAPFSVYTGIPTALRTYGVAFADMNGLTAGVWPATAGTLDNAGWVSGNSAGTMPIVYFSSLT